MVETPPTSYIFPSFNLIPLKLTVLHDGDFYSALVLAGALVMLNLQLLLSCWKLYKQKLAKFLSDVWNVLDVLIVMSGWACTILWFTRYIKGETAIERMSSYGGRQYVNMGELALITQVFVYTLGSISFFTSIRFLWLLKFNKRVAAFIDTLSLARQDLFAYGFIFFIIFVGFSTMVYVLLGPKLLMYSNMKLVMESLFSILLGKFEFSEIFEADPVLGPYLFMSYAVCMAIVALNLFICILNISIHEIRNDLVNRSNEFEVVEFVLKKISRLRNSRASAEKEAQDLLDDEDEVPLSRSGFRFDLGVLDHKWRRMRSKLREWMQREQNEVKYRIDQLEHESEDETWQTVIGQECNYYGITNASEQDKEGVAAQEKTLPRQQSGENGGGGDEVVMRDWWKKSSVDHLRHEVQLIGRVVTELMSSSDEDEENDTVEYTEALLREVTGLSERSNSAKSTARSSSQDADAEGDDDDCGKRNPEARRKRRRFIKQNFKREHLEDM